MKKTTKLFWPIAAFAIVFSCSRESFQENFDIVSSEKEDEEAIIPAVDGNPLTCFGVSFEIPKVSVDIDSGHNEIEKDDEVLVYVSGSNYATYIYDGSHFVLKEGETAVTLDAPASVFYPADEFEAGSAVKFVKPAPIEASGDFGAISPMAGIVTDSEGAYSVTLGNLASVLRVKVNADVNINSVTLDYGSMIYYAADSKYYVNAADLTMNRSDNSDNTYETVTLSTPATSADLLFVIPTLPLPDGLTVTAHLAANHNGGANSFTVVNSSTDARVRGKISTLSFKAKLFDGGQGTSESPYLIASSKDFKNIHKYTTEGYTPGSKTTEHFLTAYYRQTADIDLKSSALTPIGNSSATSAQFKGHYDGNSKTLKNVSVNVDTQFAAVFGYVSGSAEIKNLTVTGSVTKTGTTDYSCAAGIVGILNGNAQVTGCTNRAAVTSTSTYTGGVVGRMYAATAGISDCKNLGIIEGVSNVGGVVGQLNAGTLSSSENSNKVTASGECVGGIAGQMNGASVIENCSNDAMITSESSTSSYAAGIVGKSNGSEGSVVSCVNEGYVKANKPFTGGIAGDMNGTIDKCINKGMIESTSSNVGGIAGSLRASSIVKRSYSSKGKTITGTNRIGGVVGVQNGAGSWVVSCFSNSNVTGTANTADYGVGGIVGILTNGTVANCSTGDVTVICSASCSKAADAKVYVGGIVGYQDADGTIQNVYSPLYAKDIKIGSIHGRSGSGKIGQIAGYAGGPLIGYYFGGCATATTGWQYWGTTASDPTPSHLAQWAFTSANNVSMDWSAPVAKNYSNFGVSFTSGTYYLSNVMNVAISQDPLASGYTPVTGEVLTWSARDAVNNDYHPIPDALLTLGADYYDN